MNQTVLQVQQVRDARRRDGDRRRERGALGRRVVAGPAGLGLLLAGGGLLIKVALLTFHEQGLAPHVGWVFTAVACLLAGVALVLIALPKIAGDRGQSSAQFPKDPSAVDSSTGQGASGGGKPLGGRLPTT